MLNLTAFVTEKLCHTGSLYNLFLLRKQVFFRQSVKTQIQLPGFYPLSFPKLLS